MKTMMNAIKNELKWGQLTEGEKKRTIAFSVVGALFPVFACCDVFVAVCVLALATLLIPDKLKKED